MQIIDFDAKFTDVLNDWIEKNRSRFRKPDDMENEVPDVYLRWLNTPADWLDGACPGSYFEKFDSAAELCELLKAYLNEEVSVPDPLLDRLEELGDEQELLNLVKDKAAPMEARMTAVEILRALESTVPMVDYIRWQVERNDDEDLLDNTLESLRQMGEAARKPAKLAFTVADAAGKEALLDLLADYPGDEDVFQFALQQFKTTKDKLGLYAGYLAKLDDDRALEHLLDVAESDGVSYSDFIEIRSAIERLGSEAPVKDWSNDPTYKAFRRLQRM